MPPSQWVPDAFRPQTTLTRPFTDRSAMSGTPLSPMGPANHTGALLSFSTVVASAIAKSVAPRAFFTLISLTMWSPRIRTATGFRSARYRRSEEHTSELQSQSNLVCRLLLEKKKKKIIHDIDHTEE